MLHELLVSLPHEDFVYLGDTARFPYGERSRAELEAFALAIAEELLARRCKLLVVACNSATAAALPAPAAADARDDARRRRHRRRAARGAAGGGRDAQRPDRPARDARDRRQPAPTSARCTTPTRTSTSSPSPCPDLAPIIQGGFPFDQHVVDTVRAYCEPLRAARVDTVILGCTHYPLVRPMLQRSLGRSVTILTSGAAVGPPGRARALARATSTPRARARASYSLPVHRRRRQPSARWAPASCRCRSARSRASSCPRSPRRRSPHELAPVLERSYERTPAQMRPDHDRARVRAHRRPARR